MKLGTCCYQRPWKTCRTSWSHSPPTAHSPPASSCPHSQSSCEKQFEQKVSLNLRSRRRHRFLTHRIPPPSPARGRGKAISYPQSGHFSVSLQPFLLLLLFYSALISKVALRVPKIISNGITLNEMQSTSSTNNKQQQQQEQQKKGQMIIKRGRADVEAVPGTEAEVIASERARGGGRRVSKGRDRDRRPRTGGNRGCCDECLTPDRQQSQKLLINSP